MGCCFLCGPPTPCYYGTGLQTLLCGSDIKNTVETSNVCLFVVFIFGCTDSVALHRPSLVVTRGAALAAVPALLTAVSSRGGAQALGARASL